MRPEWTNAQKIVIKIGSSLLVNKESGTLKNDWMATLVEDIDDLLQQGKQVVIVSSGAIALGRRALNLPKGQLKLEHSQAAAATGQVGLTQAYQDLFAHHDRVTSQILVTLDDTEVRVRHVNARNTILSLLSLGAVPIVNENDTVSTHEIRFGDNDRLAARVASMIEADLLILLSDIDGLYTGVPGKDPDAKRLEVVEEITPEIEAMAGSVGSDYGTGGMITKLIAGKIAMQAGAHMVITSGLVQNPLKALAASGDCTWFLSSTSPGSARKRWIAGTLVPEGQIIIDDGAANALQSGKSLLPAGVTDIIGDFNRGDTVSILTSDGEELARGLTVYTSVNARKIIGKQSEEIADILGYPGRASLVHRDDMVLL